MNTFFSLLEQLVSLTAPSIVVLQSLLGVTLLPVKESRFTQFFEARPSTGLIARVDYRIPVSNDPPKAPFLVMELRDESIHFDDFRKRLGDVYPSDISAHHPHFIGYRGSFKGYPVRVKVSAKTNAVLAVMIDYAEIVVKADNGQPETPVRSSTKRPND